MEEWLQAGAPARGERTLKAFVAKQDLRRAKEGGALAKHRVSGHWGDH